MITGNRQAAMILNGKQMANIRYNAHTVTGRLSGACVAIGYWRTVARLIPYNSRTLLAHPTVCGSIRDTCC